MSDLLPAAWLLIGTLIGLVIVLRCYAYSRDRDNSRGRVEDILNGLDSLDKARSRFSHPSNRKGRDDDGEER